jgi:hypothetical protein
MARDGRVRALMTVKKRRNALRLSRADMQFLAAACGAATLAHTGLAQPESAPEVEELGLLCSACGRVEEWRIDAGWCECGGEWTRAALPKIVPAICGWTRWSAPAAWALCIAPPIRHSIGPWR